MAEVWNTPVFDFQTTGQPIEADDLNTLGNNLRFLERIAYVEFTSDVSVTATSVGAANQIVSAGPITYEAVPHRFEFYCGYLAAVTTIHYMIFRDGTTVIGTLARQASGVAVGNFGFSWYYTPSAASHTFNVAGWNDAAGTWVYNAGSGGTAGTDATMMPGSLAVYRIPT